MILHFKFLICAKWIIQKLILGQQQGNPVPVPQNVANIPQPYLQHERVPMNIVKVPNVRERSVGRNDRERRVTEEEYRSQHQGYHGHHQVNPETSVDSTFTKAIVQVPYANQANVINLKRTKTGVSDSNHDRISSSCHPSMRQNEKVYPSEPSFAHETNHNSLAFKTNDPMHDGRNIIHVPNTKPSGQRREFRNKECLVTNPSQNLVVRRK